MDGSHIPPLQKQGVGVLYFAGHGELIVWVKVKLKDALDIGQVELEGVFYALFLMKRFFPSFKAIALNDRNDIFRLLVDRTVKRKDYLQVARNIGIVGSQLNAYFLKINRKDAHSADRMAYKAATEKEGKGGWKPNERFRILDCGGWDTMYKEFERKEKEKALERINEVKRTSREYILKVIADVKSEIELNSKSTSDADVECDIESETKSTSDADVESDVESKSESTSDIESKSESTSDEAPIKLVKIERVVLDSNAK